MLTNFFQSRFFFGFYTVFFACVCLVLFLISQVIGFRAATGDKKKLITQEDIKKIPGIFLLSSLLFYVAIPIIWRIWVEKASVFSLGLFGSSKNIFYWFLWIGFSLFIGFVASQLGGDRQKRPSWKQFIFLIYVYLLVGVTEEFIFRFFLAGRFALIFNMWIAIGISTLFFTFLHLQTPSVGTKRIYYILYVIMTSVFLGFEYFYFQSIWICVISHFLINLISNTVPSFRKERVENALLSDATSDKKVCSTKN